MEYSGIKTLNYSNINQLQKEFLYFDNIYFDPAIYENQSKLYSLFFERTNQIDKLQSVINTDSEIDYLVKNNVIKEVSFDDLLEELIRKLDDTKFDPKNKLDEYQLTFFNDLEFIVKYIQDLEEEYTLNLNKKDTGTFARIIGIREMKYQLLVRMNSKLLPALRETNEVFTPIVNDMIPFQNKSICKRNEVIDIVINKFPAPEGDVSWEQIIDFKNDTDSRRKLLRLKNWAVKMGHSKYNALEIEQELEFLLREYEHRMKLQKLKYKTGNLELLITSGVEFIGNIISFQWGKAAKALFDIRKREIDLLIGETKAPGKEIAYISKANEKLNNSPQKLS